jgi:hypothetical protein
MCKSTRRRMGLIWAALPCCDDRIVEETAAAEADSGDELWRPGSVLLRGRWRRLARRGRGLNSRCAEAKGAGINGELKRGREIRLG